MKEQRDSMRWKEEIFGLGMPTSPQNYFCLTILMDLNFSSIFWFLIWVVFPFFKWEPLPSSQHLTVVKIAPRILFDDIPFKGDKLWLFDQITDNSQTSRDECLYCFSKKTIYKLREIANRNLFHSQTSQQHTFTACNFGIIGPYTAMITCPFYTLSKGVSALTLCLTADAKFSLERRVTAVCIGIVAISYIR